MMESERLAMRWRLHDLREAVLAVDPAAMREACEALAADLDEPLRIAVVGRVKAGKSTLVNGLIGRRVARTDEAECTRIVTWYRYGTTDRADLHLLDGRVLPLGGTASGLLPEDLPVPLVTVSHAVVQLHEAPLKDYTLIDTPGLATTTEGNDAATRRAVLQTEQAHALLYVFRDVELADDVAFLREFAAASGARGGSALDSLGVLTHADEFGAGPWADPDPIPQAAEFARRVAARRRAELAAVVPVAGRLAEATLAEGISERDARALAAVADLDPEDLRDRFDLPPGCTAQQVDDLVRRLGAYAVARGRAEAARGAAAFARWARASGGTDALQVELRAHYVGRHAQLRATRALSGLEAAADRSPLRSEVRNLIAEARLDPALHPLAELAAWETLRAAEPQSPLLGRLIALIDADDDRSAVGLPRSASGTVVRRTARAAAEAAQNEAVFASLLAERQAALTLSRSYRRIAARWAA